MNSWFSIDGSSTGLNLGIHATLSVFGNQLDRGFRDTVQVGFGKVCSTNCLGCHSLYHSKCKSTNKGGSGALVLIHPFGKL